MAAQEVTDRRGRVAEHRQRCGPLLADIGREHDGEPRERCVGGAGGDVAEFGVDRRRVDATAGARVERHTAHPSRHDLTRRVEQVGRWILGLHVTGHATLLS